MRDRVQRTPAAASISQDDAAQIVKNLERNGRPVPPALRKAAAGQTDEPPAAPEPEPKPEPEPAPAPVREPERPRIPEPRSASPSPAARPRRAAAGPSAKPAPKATRPARSHGAVHRWGNGGKLFRKSGSSSGDIGGILLAVWVYPIVLAVIKYGTAGGKSWISGHFVNRPDSGTAAKTTTPASQTTPITPSPTSLQPAPAQSDPLKMPAYSAYLATAPGTVYDGPAQAHTNNGSPTAGLPG